MSRKPDGGSAFPTLTQVERFVGNKVHTADIGARMPTVERTQELSVGMSLRDYYAGQALVGLSNGDFFGHAPEYAQRAYELADAMLAERAK